MDKLRVVQDDQELANFDPAIAKETIAKGEAIIDYAKQVKDWPTLIEAVDAMIKHQRIIVKWWRVNVTSGHGGDQVRRTAHLPFREAEDLIGFAHQTISKWEQRLEDEAVYKTRLFGASYKEAMASLDDSELVQQSLSNEHYTPAKYIEAARTVLGEIDLDPASCALANKTVKAAEFFAEEHNGLEREWRGRVWLNPPYGRLVGDFISKLMAEMGAGRVSAAVVLVNAHCTDTAWFQPLWDGWLCFTDHRINFTGDDERSGSTHGSVFSYFGSRKTLFKKSFLRFGSVVGRV